MYLQYHALSSLDKAFYGIHRQLTPYPIRELEAAESGSQLKMLAQHHQLLVIDLITPLLHNAG